MANVSLSVTPHLIGNDTTVRPITATEGKRVFRKCPAFGLLDKYLAKSVPVVEEYTEFEAKFQTHVVGEEHKAQGVEGRTRQFSFYPTHFESNIVSNKEVELYYQDIAMRMATAGVAVPRNNISAFISKNRDDPMVRRLADMVRELQIVRLAEMERLIWHGTPPAGSGTVHDRFVPLMDYVTDPNQENVVRATSGFQNEEAGKRPYSIVFVNPKRVALFHTGASMMMVGPLQTREVNRWTDNNQTFLFSDNFVQKMSFDVGIIVPPKTNEHDYELSISRLANIRAKTGASADGTLYDENVRQQIYTLANETSSDTMTDSFTYAFCGRKLFSQLQGALTNQLATNPNIYYPVTYQDGIASANPKGTVQMIAPYVGYKYLRVENIVFLQTEALDVDEAVI